MVAQAAVAGTARIHLADPGVDADLDAHRVGSLMGPRLQRGGARRRLACAGQSLVGHLLDGHVLEATVDERVGQLQSDVAGADDDRPAGVLAAVSCRGRRRRSPSSADAMSDLVADRADCLDGLAGGSCSSRSRYRLPEMIGLASPPRLTAWPACCGSCCVAEAPVDGRLRDRHSRGRTHQSSAAASDWWRLPCSAEREIGSSMGARLASAITDDTVRMARPRVRMARRPGTRRSDIRRTVPSYWAR